MKNENRSTFYKLVFILLIVLILIIIPFLIQWVWAVVFDLIIMNACLIFFLWIKDGIKTAIQYPDYYNENLNNK